MPNEDSVLVLMGKVAMDKSGFNRELPGIDRDQNLFPSEVWNFSPRVVIPGWLPGEKTNKKLYIYQAKQRRYFRLPNTLNETLPDFNS